MKLIIRIFVNALAIWFTSLLLDKFSFSGDFLNLILVARKETTKNITHPQDQIRLLGVITAIACRRPTLNLETQKLLLFGLKFIRGNDAPISEAG